MSTITPRILQTNVGEAIDATLDILNSVDNVAMPQIESAYSSEVQGAAQGEAETVFTPSGTPSLFNPFYIFRYSKFGTVDAPDAYRIDQHKDLTIDILQTEDRPSTDTPSQYKLDRKGIENPTAETIIQWAKENSEFKEGMQTSPVPYQWNDFLWCKWYGKIPNNRLLTLRRYPIPVEDNLRISSENLPIIPLAQAVTWWGADTGNTLGSILGMDFGLKWTSKVATVQDVTGNEPAAEKLLDSFGVENKALRKVILATLFDNPDNPQAFTGLDAKLQEWVRASYGNEGPYWNRILGPVNVVNSTQIRDRGMDYRHPIKLEFSYKLRSFGNINPRVAFLDLISNFLSLTYNNAQFWGGAARYFQQTGPILTGLNSEAFEKGDFITGIGDNLKNIVANVQGKGEEITKLIDSLGKKITEADVLKLITLLKDSRVAQNLAGASVKDILQKPLLIRSFLDGRAVGEWHLTVGNPMDPIAVIGNLIVTSTQIKFSEDLGLDDFPSEVKFTVTLDHARPRARQDILSMFNLGGGDMYINDSLQPPSSAFNSNGERNSITQNQARGNETTQTQTPRSFKNVQTSGVDLPSGTGPSTLAEAESVANKYRQSISKAYGEGFGNSNYLPRYFFDLKTKD
jgi:hypothetical protein